MTDDLVQRFRAARRDRSLTVLEGFHALKHGLRFGAEPVEIVATDPALLDELARDLAPDVRERLAAAALIDEDTLAALAPQAPRTGVMAIARRPQVDVPALLGDPRERPVVLLEEPRNMRNMGACVRVSAAADVAGVLTTGPNDPWHPDALRGGAGLHYALPVARLEALPGAAERQAAGRPLLAIDPDGEELRPGALPARALLAFGTERHGLSNELLAQADARIRIPMREGVSSLNLATSVAALLFAWRLHAR